MGFDSEQPHMPPGSFSAYIIPRKDPFHAHRMTELTEEGLLKNQQRFSGMEVHPAFDKHSIFVHSGTSRILRAHVAISEIHNARGIISSDNPSDVQARIIGRVQHCIHVANKNISNGVHIEDVLSWIAKQTEEILRGEDPLQGPGKGQPIQLSTAATRRTSRVITTADGSQITERVLLKPSMHRRR